MESEQYVTKQLMYYSRNQIASQKISGDKWKWKQTDQKYVEYGKSSSKRDIFSNMSYLRKQEKSQINNLISKRSEQK